MPGLRQEQGFEQGLPVGPIGDREPCELIQPLRQGAGRRRPMFGIAVLEKMAQRRLCIEPGFAQVGIFFQIRSRIESACQHAARQPVKPRLMAAVLDELRKPFFFPALGLIAVAVLAEVAAKTLGVRVATLPAPASGFGVPAVVLLDALLILTATLLGQALLLSERVLARADCFGA